MSQYILNSKSFMWAAIHVSVRDIVANLILMWLTGPRRLQTSWRLKFEKDNVLLWALHFKFLSLPFIQAKGNDCEGNTKPEARGNVMTSRWKVSWPPGRDNGACLYYVVVSGLGRWMRVLKDRNEPTQSTDAALDRIKHSLVLITPTKAHCVMRV